MNFLDLGISPDLVVTIFNIVILVIVLLCSLIGFWRGTKKSVFYLICTTIFLWGFFILGLLFTDTILGIDVSFITDSISIGDDTYAVSSIKDTAVNVLNGVLFNDATEATVTMSIVEGVVGMLFRLVWLIVCVVLSFTLFRIISGIVWIFVRPKKVEIEGKKKKKRPKPRLGSRFGGLGIGFAKGLMYILLIVFIFAGLVSIVETYEDASEELGLDSLSYNMVLIDDTATLVEVNQEEEEPIFGEYQEIVDLLLAYKDTAPAKVFGTIEINDTSLDEWMFDQIFKINVDELGTSIKLRKELNLVADALAECPELFEDGFSFEKIIELSKDPDASVRLKKAVEKLSKLKLVKVTVPVALEVVVLGNLITDELDDENLIDLIKGLDLEELKKINYGLEVKNLGYAFVDVISLFENDGSFDFFKMDSETVKKVFASIEKVQMIEQLAPVAISYVLTMDELVKALDEMGIEAEDLGLNDIENWNGEIKILGDVLSSFVEIGLTEEDIKNFENIELDDEMLGKIDNFTEVLFTSNIIKNAIPVLAKVGINQIPEEYADLIVIPSETDADYWQTELRPLIKAALSLLSTGILNLEENEKIEDVISELSDEKIEELAMYLSQSNILKDSLNNVIDKLVSAEVDEDGNVIKEGLLGDIVVKGFNSSSEWTEEEICSIFKGLSVILKAGIIDSEDYIQTLSELNDETIETLASSLSNSKFIKQNLSEILKMLLEEMNTGENEFTVQVLEEDEWTELELSCIFNAFREIAKSGLLSDEPTEAFKTLEDESIDSLAYYLANSKFVKINLNSIIDMLIGEVDLGGVTIKGFEDDSNWSESELKNLFKGFSTIFKSGLIGSDDYMKSLSELEDETIEELASSLSGSKFIKQNLSEILKMLLEEMQTGDNDFTPEVLEEDEWTELELTSIFKAFKEIASSGLLDEGSTDAIQQLSDKQIDDLSTYISSSKFLTKNLTPIMDMLLGSMDLGNIEIKGFEDSSKWTKQEIASLLKGSTIVVSYTDDLTQMVKMSEDDLDTLMTSDLISNVLVDFIKESSKEGESLEIIEGIELVSDDEWKDVCVEDIKFTYTSGVVQVTENLENDVDKYYVYVLNQEGIYEKVTSSIEKEIDLNSVVESGAKRRLQTLPSVSDIKVSAYSYGEIRKMFLAVQAICKDNEITEEGIVEALTMINDSDIETILESKIVCETLICQIEGFATKEDAVICIPEGELTKINADETKDRTAWLEKENGEHGELYKVLKAITILFAGKDLNNLTFSTDIFTSIEDEEIDIILSSEIINETLIVKIDEMANESEQSIYIPSELKTDGSIDREKWNEANESKNLLYALKTVCAGGEINLDNMKLKVIIDENEEILKSLVICETIKQNIIKIEEISQPEDLDVNTLEGWKNEYDVEGNLVKQGELSHLLKAVEIALSIDETSTLDSIQDAEFKLNDISSERTIILRSKVIATTVRGKIEETEGVELPNNYNDENDTDNYINWYNEYDENGDLLSTGELDALLAALEILFGNEEVNFDNIKLNTVIENEAEMLKSLIITETLKKNIISVEEISQPEDLETNTLKGWRNIYDVNGNVIKRGEISYLLKAIKIVLNVDDSTTLDSIQNAEFSLNDITHDREEVLRSKVIATTVKDKVIETEGVNLPSNYQDKNDADNYVDWYNDYNDNGDLLSTGELDALLAALDVMFGTEEINFDNIKINKVIENENTMLKSLIITETIKKNIISMDDLQTPNNLKDNTLKGWRNTYDVNGVLVNRGEVSYLLKAVNVALDINDDSTLNSIQGLEIDLAKIIDGRDVALHSQVISYTIQDKIVNNPNVNLPAEWNNSNNKNNFIYWDNQYNGDNVTYRGELDALLVACKELFGSNEISFDNLGSFDYSSLFEDAATRKLIITSKVISETMIVKIETMVDSSLYVPNNKGLTEVTNRSAWWNTENGELLYFMDGASLLLTNDEKSQLANITLGVDKVYNTLMNEEDREVILKSYLLSETLAENFKDLDIYKNNTPSISEIGVDLENNNEWYSISISASGRSIEKKELWHLITSINLILGSNYNSSSVFELNNIFGVNSNLAPSAESLVGNRYFEADWVNMNIFLESLLMQKIFEDTLYAVIAQPGGLLYGKVNNPIYGAGDGNYLRFSYTYNNYVCKNPDSLSAYEMSELVEFDTNTLLRSIIIMNKAGLNYDELSQFESASNETEALHLLSVLQNIDWNIFVDAFMASRAFRGSIEGMLNPIFETIYGLAYVLGYYTGHIIPTWDSVKLNNGDYQYPISKHDARELLYNNINNIINYIAYALS